MKKIAAVFVLFALSFSALGMEQADKTLAIEYLKVSRMEQIINTSLDAYDQQLFKNLPEEDRVNIKKMMQETLGWETNKDELAELVAGVYTKAELKAAIKFMKTPLGASYTLKSDAFSTQFSALLSHKFMKFIREHPIQPNPAVNPDAAQ